jgi:adenylate kinase family enzyme
MKMAPENLLKNYKRIVVVGTSCAGKSTFASGISKMLNLRHIELDALYWKADWQARDKEEFKELVSKEIIADRWVVDGNYHTIRDLVWSRAELIIWLNYDFGLVIKRAFYRTFKRIITKEQIY